MYDLDGRCWDEGALGLAGITAARLPQLADSAFVEQSGFTAEASQRIGIKPGTPLVLGGADGVLANVGAGAVGPGIAAVTVGTSGAVRISLTGRYRRGAAACSVMSWMRASGSRAAR